MKTKLLWNKSEMSANDLIKCAGMFENLLLQLAAAENDECKFYFEQYKNLISSEYIDERITNEFIDKKKG